MIAGIPRENQPITKDASALFQRGEACLHSRNVAQALYFYKEAERAGFEADACSGARWTCQMLLGDFAAAWQESEFIQLRGKHDPNRFWSGAPLAQKRVLVRCLHGLGDTIQFARYAPLLRRVTRHLTIEAQPALKELLAASNLADHVMTWGEPEPPYEEQIEVIELPRIFGTTLANVPASVPYLNVPQGTQGRANVENPRPRIGIVWASSHYNIGRSVPLLLLEPILLQRPHLQFFSFQAEPDRQDLGQCCMPLTDLFDESGNVAVAAKRLQAMDLFLTVDTMMAHLAGALAVPVWTLLPFEADWRWMLQRADTPWYPSMKLFRQPAPGDWHSVIESLAAALDFQYPRG